MRVLHGALLALLCLVLLAGCATARASYDIKTTTIEVQTGQEFSIRLDSNITTGYSWQLGAPLDGKVLVLVGSQYVEPKTDAVGAGGQEVWTFKAVAPGKTTIALNYLRPWEKDVAPAQTAAFAVTVR